MSFRTFVISIAIVALLAHSPAVKAQQARGVTSDWSGVKAIPPGDELVVKLKDGKTVKGRLVSVSDTTLTLSRKNKATELAQGNIFRVYRIALKSGVGSKALIGAGIGAGSGIAVGSLGDDNKAGLMLGLGVIGAGLGALIGLAFADRHEQVLVYEAK